MASTEPASTSMDVFGAVLTPVHHSQEDSPVRPLSFRAGSRRTQSVDITSRNLATPSPRRKRGERDKIRAELDAAPGLALDPRIASDVLALERRFAAVSKGKSPARPLHRTHRTRHSLPASTLQIPSSGPPPLSTLPEITPASGPNSPLGSSQALVGPALPSSAVHPDLFAPTNNDPDPPPAVIKIDKPAYAALLPGAESETTPLVEAKRATKAAKRTSLTAMLGLGRKKSKELRDPAKDEDKHGILPGLRPSPKRGDTHYTTRTFNTMLTTHTNATAGSVESGDPGSLSGVGSSHGHGQGTSLRGRPASATSSNPALGVFPVEPPTIEPSAKTLARAAAARDQLAKRYGMLYASLGDAISDEFSSRSGSRSLLKQASPSPDPGSAESYPNPPSKDHPSPRGINLLDVIRWRTGVLERARAGEVEPQGTAYPSYSGSAYAGSGVPAYQNAFPAPLGDSLPEANSLGWLPYLEPVFSEERARADGVGEFGQSAGCPANVGTVGSGTSASERRGKMTAWYVLASFVEGYITAKEREEAIVADRSIESDGKALPLDPPRDPLSKAIISDVRAQALVNATYARSAGSDAHGHSGTGTISDDGAPGAGSRFAIIDRALRTRSRRSSVILEGVNRSRHSSLLASGTASEPPSPSHLAAFSLPIFSSSSQLSHPHARRSTTATGSRLVPPTQGETRFVRSNSGSRIHARPHSRTQSQARSISAGNPGLKSSTTEFGVVNLPSKPAPAVTIVDPKSMSPASSRLNLANFIIGGAAVLGLNMRRGTKYHLHHKDGVGVSGSENEGESGKLSSDVSPSDGDGQAWHRRRVRRERQLGGAGASDGEGGRVKRRRTLRKECESGGLVSDGGVEGDGRGLRVDKPDAVSAETEKSDQEGEDREYERKKAIVENAQDVLGDVNMRLLSFAQTLEDLNGVHQAGSDVFGEMFLPVPQEVVSILTPELSDDEETDYTSAAPALSTPTDPLSLVPLGSFARKLENLERSPAVVDSSDRSTLDAGLPLAAFNALHELDQMVDKITRQILDLRRLCEDAEEERKAVKQLYDSIAGNVGTTYPECTRIEQLLGSLVTEDMPWLPSWLPLWVRHLLEIFSGQIQFLVENGLRIYGYVYSAGSLVIFLFTLLFSVAFFFAHFVKSYWWVFLGAGLAMIVYLMMRPPEGVDVDI